MVWPHGEEGEPKAMQRRPWGGGEPKIVSWDWAWGWAWACVALATIGRQSSAEPNRHNASSRADGEEGEPEPEVDMVGEPAQLGKRAARNRKQNSATR